MRRSIGALGIVTVLVLFQLTPAAGTPISGHRHWGEGNYHLLPSQVSTGNMVGFWQSFIAAYGTIPCTGVDGIFGPKTTNGTKSIQNFFGLTPDGIVGKQTWNAASHWLHAAGNDGFVTTYWVPNYANSVYPFYAYTYGGPWRWHVPTVTAPFETLISTNHPAVTFGNEC